MAVFSVNYALGHGVCDKVSRLCLCEAFWMQNLWRKYFGDEESNCGKILF